MSQVERLNLSPQHNISRVIKGGWQLAGGHGAIDQAQALADMAAYVGAGITTFDCADIYTGVEELIGAFLRQYRPALQAGDLPPVQVHTKYVPDLSALATLTYADTAAIIERSLTRLGVERLDLVQFHWWDYDTPGYVETAQHLQRLQQAGKIKHVAVTNFDAAHLGEILGAGVVVTSCQVQYSPLDRRPRGDLLALCRERGIWLLCYGTVAGGFLSDRYLGAPEPQEPLENRSLTKYKLIIDDFGGWELFQALLRALRAVADRHDASTATVATRYSLAQERVAAAIVGARHARHLPDTLRLFDFDLTAADLDEINAVIAQASGPQGPVYGLERIKGGKHAGVMKYNLNKE
jgi:aryl-alcohol dehydrogenase-like predicted oxidoreductase